MRKGLTVGGFLEVNPPADAQHRAVLGWGSHIGCQPPLSRLASAEVRTITLAPGPGTFQNRYMAFGIYGVRSHEKALFQALAIRSPDWAAAQKALENFDSANRLRVSEDRNKAFFARLKNAFLNGPDALVASLAKIPMMVDVYPGNDRVSDGPAIRKAWLAERKKLSAKPKVKTAKAPLKKPAKAVRSSAVKKADS